MDRRSFIKTAGGLILTVGSGTYAFRILSATGANASGAGSPLVGKKWGMVIDLNKCKEGCTKCMDACRNENNVSFHGDNRWDNHWIRKVRLEGEVGHTKIEKSVPLLCNHCDHPPCAQVCPVQATYKRDDGIVIVDHHRCIGCRYCMIACPYNARQFNFKNDEDWPNEERPKRSHGVAEACHFCAHRLDVGGIPACVEACQNFGQEAILVGDLNDPNSEVAQITSTLAVKRIREDLGTEPKVYYLGL